MECRKCHSSISEKFKFCDLCGEVTAAFEKSEKTITFLCFQCGQPLAGTRKFCTNCGAQAAGQKARVGLASWLEMLQNPRAQAAFVAGTVLFVITPMLLLLMGVIGGDEPEHGSLPETEMVSSYIIRTVAEATEKQFEELFSLAGGMAVDGAGNIFVSANGDHVVYRRDPSGSITVFAGSGKPGYDGDGGEAQNASLNHPAGLAVDQTGNLYIADSDNHRIRRVHPDGTIETVAGSGAVGAGQGSFDGDGGTALSSRLNHPTAVFVARDGTVFVADAGNRRIRSLKPRSVPKRKTK